MRCSSCESHLGEYIERSLPPLRARAVANHLKTCEACHRLHRQLRNVDGLLHTARTSSRTVDLHDAFTDAIMAQVSEMEPVPPPRRLLLPLAAIYLACGWIVLAVAYAVAQPQPQSGAHALFAAAGGLLQPVILTIRALWPVAPIAIPLVVAILIVDALLLVAIVLFYRAIRPHLVAAIARESTP